MFDPNDSSTIAVRFPTMSAVTTCLQCGALGPWGRAGRCDDHRRQQDRTRQQKRGDRYGPAHKAARRAWEPVVRAGLAVCARCSQPIDPTGPWDCDHIGQFERPSHVRCNRSATTSRRVNA